MKTSIYITSERIEAIAYKKTSGIVKIVDYASEALPERTMINGNITDTAMLVEKLSALKARKKKLFKKVSLVIDSNLLAVKEIPVPKLNKRQYFQIVKDEFANNLTAGGEAVIDYTLLKKPDNKTALFALSTSKELIAAYKHVFKDAGIELKAMRVGLETILCYIKTVPELRDKTFIMNIVDGFSMLSVVFSNGNNVLSTRTRLVGDDDETLMQSIIGNLSPLIQFTQSQKLPELYKCYYLGLPENMTKMLGTSINNADVFDLLKGVKNADKITDPCHLSFMGIYNDGGIDLLHSYLYAKENLRDYKPVSALWLLPVLGVLAISAAFAVPTLVTRTLNEKIAVIEQYLNNETVKEKVEKINEIEAETSRLASLTKEIDDAYAEKESFPRMTRELVNLIVRTDPSVVIDSFNMNDEHFVTISGSSDTQMDSSRYAERLLANGLIESVEYTGYRFDSSNRFGFSILVKLHGNIEPR